MSQRKTPPPPFTIGHGINPKPGLDGTNDFSDPKKGARQIRRTIASPCDRPPATPTGVQMRFRAIEARTHLTFKGRIVWDDVTEDTSGFRINTVDRWDVRWRAVDSDGDPLEVEHSALRDATNPSGSTYRFTTERNHGWTVGDTVKVKGCSPQTQYNGTWVITAIGTPNRFDVTGSGSGLADAKRPGEVYDLSTEQSFRRKLRNPVESATLRSASHTTGPNKHHYTTRGANGFNVGQKIRVSGCVPTDYNGDFVIDAIFDEDSFTVVAGSGALADATTVGKVVDRDDFLHVVMEAVPRPKSWSWQAKVRCRSGEGCWSAFSPWTTPILPWDGADPRPPVPTYGAFPITFDRKGKDEKHKLRLLFTYDEVSFWDVPGGDREDDVRGYDVQIDQSEDGVNWDTAHGGGTPYRTQHRPAMDDDADTTRVAVFPRITRRYWYRARVRTVDRFNRRGDWPEWTDPALPFDDTDPPTPTDVEIYSLSTDRVVVEWDDPTIDLPLAGTVAGTSGTATLTGTGTHFLHELEAGALLKIESDSTIYTVLKVTSPTALTLTTNLGTSPAAKKIYEVVEDPDVDFYTVQLATYPNVDLGTTPNEWQQVYARDRQKGKRHAFKIRDADISNTFYARVRAIDAARNRSEWIPAWVRTLHSGDANSDPDADADGVVVLPGVPNISAEFHAPNPGTPSTGQIDTGTIPKKWTNEGTTRLWFQYARMVCDPDHEPTGADIIVQIQRFEDDDVTSANIFTSGNRLRINADEHRSGREDNFDILYLDPGESLQCTIQQVGSGNHGQDLDITVWMSLAPPVA